MPENSTQTPLSEFEQDEQQRSKTKQKWKKWLKLALTFFVWYHLFFAFYLGGFGSANLHEHEAVRIEQEQQRREIDNTPLADHRWEDASEVYEDEQVKIKITDARIGKPKLKSLGIPFSAYRNFLIIELDITNKGKEIGIGYGGWSPGFSGTYSGILFDEQGNYYLGIYFSIKSKVVGQLDSQGIALNETKHELLVFERPDSSIKQLHLALDPGAIGRREDEFYLTYNAELVEGLK